MSSSSLHQLPVNVQKKILRQLSPKTQHKLLSTSQTFLQGNNFKNAKNRRQAISQIMRANGLEKQLNNVYRNLYVSINRELELQQEISNLKRKVRNLRRRLYSKPKR